MNGSFALRSYLGLPDPEPLIDERILWFTIGSGLTGYRSYETQWLKRLNNKHFNGAESDPDPLIVSLRPSDRIRILYRISKTESVSTTITLNATLNHTWLIVGEASV